MSEADWDNGQEAVALPLQGRVFGMRGRGFKPVEKVVGLQHETGEDDFNNRRPGFKNRNHTENEIHENNCNDNFKENGSELTENFKVKCNMNGDETKTEKPKASLYIPKDLLEDEELFSGDISTGINFSKYDDIDVKVSGENVPKKIENFEEVNLLSSLTSIIHKCGYSKPTPIQKYAIPIIMNRRDLLACAQTGSGKTAAFLIPIINMLLKEEASSYDENKNADPQVLIVSPTRELAIQTYVEAKKFTLGSNLKAEIIYGGTSVHYQKRKIQGCNILIATPGRLIDFLERKKPVVNLSEIRHLVFDEADRMLDLNFLPDIEKIMAHPSINKEIHVQILMFSATFPDDVQRLAAKFLQNYLFLAVGIVGGACTDVEQKFYSVSKYEKRAKLLELLESHGSVKTLVFVQQKRTADIIAAFLSERGTPATSMHGDREQKLREEALNDFKCGKMDVLVATAVAARGLNIKNVAHVINFDLPKSIDEYVHRIGRTGRVGNRGLASSFYNVSEDSCLGKDLIRILSQAQQEIPDFLEEGSDGSASSGRSKFGAKDFRKRGGSNKDNPDSNNFQENSFSQEETW